MIEVAHAMLEEGGKEMEFATLVDEIQKFLGKSDEEIRDNLSRFYTELNTDGSFIPKGNNVWDLRSRYAIDEIDEETININEVDDEGNEIKRKPKRVNAFETEDDYNNDDPEDDDIMTDDEAEIDYEEENPDDEKEERLGNDLELEDVDLDLDDEDDFEDDEDEN
jgi:DNA-directed RNA polymerase subunit delta